MLIQYSMFMNWLCWKGPPLPPNPFLPFLSQLRSWSSRLSSRDPSLSRLLRNLNHRLLIDDIRDHLCLLEQVRLAQLLGTDPLASDPDIEAAWTSVGSFVDLQVRAQEASSTGWEASRTQQALRSRRDRALEHWRTDLSGALKAMTHPPPRLPCVSVRTC